MPIDTYRVSQKVRTYFNSLKPALAIHVTTSIAHNMKIRYENFIYWKNHKVSSITFVVMTSSKCGEKRRPNKVCSTCSAQYLRFAILYWLKTCIFGIIIQITCLALLLFHFWCISFAFIRMSIENNRKTEKRRPNQACSIFRTHCLRLLLVLNMFIFV